MATATFIASDIATSGNWVGVYGADGWFLEGDSPQSSYPSYVSSVSFSGWSGPFDAGHNTDTRALQKASDHSLRNDSILYTNGTATIDLTVTGTKNISFYVWAGDSARGQSVTILDQDNAGATLDTRSITDNYTNGTYLTWSVSGHIRIRVTSTSGINGGRLSGLFFDPANVITSLSPPAILAGTTKVVTVTGANTAFTGGTTSVSISGTGITVGTVTVSSSTSLTVSLTVSGSASAGARTLTVTTGSEVLTKTIHIGAAYWRLNFTQGNSSAISIADWTFADSGGSSIATTGGTASVSSSVVGSAASPFDGDSSTFVAIGPAPSWLQYQFTSDINPASFLIRTRSDLGTQVPYDLAVQYSTDGAIWTNLYVYYGLPWSGANGANLTLDGSNCAPATIGISWRLLITADSAGQSTTIAELKWYDNSSAQIATTRYAAITSSTLDGANMGMNAYDGSLSSFWASGPTPSSGSPQSLGYRFSDASIYPARFSITARNTSPTQAPSAFKLQSSTDESTWTDVQTYSPATWTTGNQVQTFVVSSAPSGSQPCFFVLM